MIKVLAASCPPAPQPPSWVPSRLDSWVPASGTAQLIGAALIAGAVMMLTVIPAMTWLENRYQLQRPGRRRFRVTRRWYAEGAQVVAQCLPTLLDGPVRYRVLEWRTEPAAGTWLCVGPADASADYLDPFWASLTMFQPYAVRRFRPFYALRCAASGLRVSPWFWDYAYGRAPEGADA